MKTEDIKFRVWAPYRGGYFFDWSAKEYWKLHGVSQERLVFQQYTGVKDINQQEIYEGDFVILRYANFPEEYSRRNVYEIVFDRGGFDVTPRKLAKDGDFAFTHIKYIVGENKDGSTKYKLAMPPGRPLTEFNICQVVGNKFQNPKLIK